MALMNFGPILVSEDEYGRNLAQKVLFEGMQAGQIPSVVPIPDSGLPPSGGGPSVMIPAQQSLRPSRTASVLQDAFEEGYSEKTGQEVQSRIPADRSTVGYLKDFQDAVREKDPEKIAEARKNIEQMLYPTTFGSIFANIAGRGGPAAHANTVIAKLLGELAASAGYAKQYTPRELADTSAGQRVLGPFLENQRALYERGESPYITRSPLSPQHLMQSLRDIDEINQRFKDKKELQQYEEKHGPGSSNLVTPPTTTRDTTMVPPALKPAKPRPDDPMSDPEVARQSFMKSAGYDTATPDRQKEIEARAWEMHPNTRLPDYNFPPNSLSPGSLERGPVPTPALRTPSSRISDYIPNMGEGTYGPTLSLRGPAWERPVNLTSEHIFNSDPYRDQPPAPPLTYPIRLAETEDEARPKLNLDKHVPQTVADAYEMLKQHPNIEAQLQIAEAKSEKPNAVAEAFQIAQHAAVAWMRANPDKSLPEGFLSGVLMANLPGRFDPQAPPGSANSRIAESKANIEALQEKNLPDKLKAELQKLQGESDSAKAKGVKADELVALELATGNALKHLHEVQATAAEQGLDIKQKTLEFAYTHLLEGAARFKDDAKRREEYGTWLISALLTLKEETAFSKKEVAEGIKAVIKKVSPEINVEDKTKSLMDLVLSSLTGREPVQVRQGPSVPKVEIPLPSPPGMRPQSLTQPRTWAPPLNPQTGGLVFPSTRIPGVPALSAPAPSTIPASPPPGGPSPVIPRPQVLPRLEDDEWTEATKAYLQAH